MPCVPREQNPVSYRASLFTGSTCVSSSTEHPKFFYFLSLVSFCGSQKQIHFHTAFSSELQCVSFIADDLSFYCNYAQEEETWGSWL